MIAIEEGVLLLCCRLGDPETKPLTAHQFDKLGQLVRAHAGNPDPTAEMTQKDLCALGFQPELAQRILSLLSRQAQLERYLAHAERLGIYPLTRVSSDYPARLTEKQPGTRTPVLFAMGDRSLLKNPCVSVVGSRHLQPSNEAFAREVGTLAAVEGWTLVSGGAVGADRTAQEACLAAGGSCVIFTPDRLERLSPRENVLYLSEDGYDIPFSSARALHRNCAIHMQGDKTVAVQCTYGRGGTWQGCTENLKHQWSELFVYQDGSEAMQALIAQGATGISALSSIHALCCDQTSLF